MKRHLVVAAAALAFAFVAGGANAQNSQDECGFEHPQKAKEVKSSLVQAFVSCGNTGGNTINAMTESGTSSCVPVETRNDQIGGHPSGWMWDEAHGQGSASFKAAKNKIANPVLDPEGDTADVAVKLKLKGVVDDAGPANGIGTIATLSRATLRDRNNTPNAHGDDVPMTVIDFPAGFTFNLEDGQAKLKTTANAILNGASIKGLPHCTSIEVVDLSVLDEPDPMISRPAVRFLSMGTFLPAK